MQRLNRIQRVQCQQREVGVYAPHRMKPRLLTDRANKERRTTRFLLQQKLKYCGSFFARCRPQTKTAGDAAKPQTASPACSLHWQPLYSLPRVVRRCLLGARGVGPTLRNAHLRVAGKEPALNHAALDHATRKLHNKDGCFSSNVATPLSGTPCFASELKTLCMASDRIQAVPFCFRAPLRERVTPSRTQRNTNLDTY